MRWLQAGSVRRVEQELKRQRPRRKGGEGWLLKGHPRFNGSLSSLLDWARKEGLLYGQRNRVVEHALLNLRNFAAHPHDPHVTTPADAARVVRDLAEIINHLWGRDTPGGRLYGTTLDMALFAVRWNAQGGLACHAQRLAITPEPDCAGRWFLIEAAGHDDAVAWSRDFETTAFPTMLVWEGDSWEEAIAAWQEYQLLGREPKAEDWRSRIFLVRRGQGFNELCRSPEQFRRLPPDVLDPANTNWVIVRADYPGDVSWHLMRLLQARASTDSEKERQPSPIEIVGVFATWEEASHRLSEVE